MVNNFKINAKEKVISPKSQPAFGCIYTNTDFGQGMYRILDTVEN